VRKERKMKGFTLVELLIVLLILGILIGLAVPRYLAALDKSKETTFCANVRNVLSAVESWRMENATTAYPSDVVLTSTIINSATYFSQPPINPYTGTILKVTPTNVVTTTEKGQFGYTAVDSTYEIKTVPDCGLK